MPKVNTRRVRRLRRRKAPKPKCLCSRSLSSSVTDSSCDLKVVFCSAKCNRLHYLHSECALAYCKLLRQCGFCRQKFVQKSVTQKSLLQAILDRRVLNV